MALVKKDPKLFPNSDIQWLNDTVENLQQAVEANGTGGGGAEATTYSSSSNGYVNARVLKNSAGYLLGIFGYNSGPQQFLQVFDSAAAVANGQAPIMVIAIAAQDNFFVSVPSKYKFLNGIYVCNSSTGPTKTIGAADCFINAITQDPITGLTVTPGSSGAYVNARQVKNAPGQLYGLFGYNNGPDQYLQLFDSPVAVADGQAPTVVFKILSQDNFFISVPAKYTFLNGIYVCNSSTAPTKTIGAADCWINSITS